MSNKAILKTQKVLVWAHEFSEDDWVKLKDSYQIGDYLMTCCGANAVPKTSPNGEQFFAHNAGECSTAPETVWHKTAKLMIKNSLKKFEIDCQEEFPGKGKDGKKWTADTYFEHQNRKIVVEIQHSYQSMTTYLKRQNIYDSSGIECYWLLMKERYGTLLTSLGKHRLRHEFNNIFPPKGGILPCIKEIPVACLEIESSPTIMGTGGFKASIDSWLKAVLDKEFVYQNGAWLIQIES